MKSPETNASRGVTGRCAGLALALFLSTVAHAQSPSGSLKSKCDDDCAPGSQCEVTLEFCPGPSNTTWSLGGGATASPLALSGPPPEVEAQIEAQFGGMNATVTFGPSARGAYVVSVLVEYEYALPDGTIARGSETLSTTITVNDGSDDREACAVWAGELDERKQGFRSERDLHNNDVGAVTCGSAPNISECCQRELDKGNLETRIDRSDEDYAKCKGKPLMCY